MSSLHLIYNTIDELPIYNYWKISETGDLKWLFKSIPTKTPDKGQIEELTKSWEQIELEVYAILINDNAYMERIRKLKAEKMQVVRAYTSNDIATQLRVNAMFHQKQSKEQNKQQQSSYHEAIAALEHKLGFPINEREMTVRRYFTHVRLLSNQNNTNG